MSDILFTKLTSRKFLAAVVAGVVAVLADAGVIDPSQAATIVVHLTPLVYIVVEGFLDLMLTADSR